MTKRHKQQRRSQALSNYTLLVQPVAYREIKQLPGHIRQRAQRAIDELTTDPRPSSSRQLEQDITSYEVCRLRLNKWRILYVIDEAWQEVAVLAIRQQPPYQYEDLEELLSGLADE